MEEYREKVLKEDIEKHLLKAEDDIKNGSVRDAEENNYIILYIIDELEKIVHVVYI